MSLHILIAGVCCCFAAGAFAAEAGGDDVLKDLRKEHPRLFVTARDWPRIRATIEKDPLAGRWFTRLQADAEKMLAEKPVEHVLIGPRLLEQSRAALRRISTLTGMYRIGGDRRFAERAKTEMLTAAAFADWNPSHFLDVAEMTTALAIGYDWLYDDLSADDRRIIRTAIVEKGLREGLKVYESKGGFTKTVYNWNQVCNGGLTIGALAVAEDEPDLAARIIAHARASIPQAMKTFAPDGGWAEGPVYWAYATRYNVYYLAALQSALGTDFGLTQLAGFDRTGFFRMQSVGPTGRSFNYADAADGPAGRAWQMLWLARTFHQGVFAAHERSVAGDRGEIFYLVWYTPDGDERMVRDLPTAALFRGIDVAFLRSAWMDKQAIYIGFKGGDNKAGHSHLDLGTFVLDAAGERWAVDLGPDDYNLPGYFGKQRWTYYRLRTESHNTLLIDGENQDLAAKAPIIAFSSDPSRQFAVADLSAAYKAKATSVLRGIALLDGKRILVQDELTAPQPVEVLWNFHTAAKVETRGTTATLTQGKSTLTATILSPQGATFDVIPANPPPPQKQQPAMKNLTVRLAAKTTTARIAVLLTPGDAAGEPPKIEPLKEWIEAGKLP